MVFDMLDEMCEAQWSNVMVVQRRTFLDFEVPSEFSPTSAGGSATGRVRALSADSALHLREAGGSVAEEAKSDDEVNEEVDNIEPARVQYNDTISFPTLPSYPDLGSSLATSSASTEDPGNHDDDDLAFFDISLPPSLRDAGATEESVETSGGESVINDDCESVCSLSTDQEDQEEHEVRIAEDGAAVSEAAPESLACSSWAYALWAPAAMGGVWGYSMQMAVEGAPDQFYEPFESQAAFSSINEPALPRARGRWGDCEDDAPLPHAAYPEWHPVHCQRQGRGSAVTNQNLTDALDCLLPHEWTTVIFKSLPINWTRDSLTELLDAEGFCGDYDFVHVPVKFQGLTNLGYALVNCASNSSANSVLQYFEGFRALSGNQLETSWSQPNQGLTAHVKRYRDSPMMHSSVPEQYKPGLFRNGVQLPFPAPTKNLRAPRVRRLKFAAC